MWHYPTSTDGKKKKKKNQNLNQSTSDFFLQKLASLLYKIYMQMQRIKNSKKQLWEQN